MESLTDVKNENIKKEICFDEPMDTNETAFDTYFEEGEINSSDDDAENIFQRRSNIPSIFTRSSSTNLNIKVAIHMDENSRKLDRAKRFALPVEDNSSPELEKEQISNLYRDLGIDKENERHYRFNAIHMRGTENMSTEDVFQYFTSYSPSHIEWINDVSCNIIWMDDISAARALLKLSKKIKNLDKVHLNADPFEKDFKEVKSIEEYECDDNAVDARQIKAAIPPGFWRFGASTEKSPCVLLRYATRSDKKQRNAERNSEYYKKYGNPHYGNLPGIITKSLRKVARKYRMKSRNYRIENSTEEIYMNTNDNKNPWKDLAYEWGKEDKLEIQNQISRRDYSPSGNSSSIMEPIVPDLRISLRNKKKNRKRLYMDENVETSQNSFDQDNWETRIKVPRMKMYADDEDKSKEENIGRRSQRNKLVSQPVEDLRSKINRKKNKPRFKFRVEKKKNVDISESESSESENTYDDGDSGDWALEEYHDLRNSLGDNKRFKQSVQKTNYQSESENYDSESDDNIYKSNFAHRSPLQIEIDNDEYYLNKRN